MKNPVELDETQKKARILALIMLAIVCLGSIGFDQITKIESEENLMIWQHDSDLKQYRGELYPLWSNGPDTVRPGKDQSFFLAFNFSYVRNQGAAWGVMSDMDDSVRVPFFYFVTLCAVIILLGYLRITPLSHRLARFSLALILSGALGNFIDRVRLGYVIDWLDVRWLIFGWRYNFPNFNFADAAISVGISLLIVDMLFLESKRKKQAIQKYGEPDAETA